MCDRAVEKGEGGCRLGDGDLTMEIRFRREGSEVVGGPVFVGKADMRLPGKGDSNSMTRGRSNQSAR